jgi:hypothetical protein
VVLNGDSFGGDLNDSGDENPKIPVTNVALDELVGLIARINVPYAEEWIQELRAGSMDAFTTLLISQLLNLKRLFLEKNYNQESRLRGMMLRSALCEKSTNRHLSPFTYLEDVSADFHCLPYEIRQKVDTRSTQDILPLFYLPSVKRIRALVDNPATFAWTGKNPPNPWRLVSLDLYMLREKHLGQVLSVTPRLQKLKWDWYYRSDLQDDSVTDIIDLDQIATGLSYIQETLTDLTITAESNDYKADLNEPELQFSGSFKAFSGLYNLKRLEVPIVFLLGFSPSMSKANFLAVGLPRGLEWLTLTDGLCMQDQWEWEYETDYFLEAIRSWLRNWKTYTPNLQGFCLLGSVMKAQDWHPDMIQELRDLGTQSGIEVQINDTEAKWGCWM